MRVLHVSTSARGGAGLAATRLIAAQKAEGIDAELLTQASGRLLDDAGTTRIPTGNRMRQKMTTFANRAMTKDEQFFFSPYSTEVVSASHLLSSDPDIIHVHNWYNFVSLKALASLAEMGVGVVFTAHDERLLTGGCHLTLGCAAYLVNCPSCPQARVPRVAAQPSLRLNQGLTQLRSSLVAPSAWLAGRLRTRLPARCGDVYHIPNCLDGNAFHPPSELRQGAPVLGVVTGKADDLISTSLTALAELVARGLAPETIVHFAGPGNQPTWPGESVSFGVLTSEAQRADFWRSCDVTLAATYGDNFPNVNLEAIFSGAVVVTCHVGGAAEAIETTDRGLAVPGRPQELAEAMAVSLRSVSQSRETAWEAWKDAQILYGGASIAGRYREVYESSIAAP
jgi:glycosyltransferase involved in cell wall biosynthesis